MSNITQADRLAADPVRLTLKDGRVVELSYGYGGLRRIEKQFGGVKAMLESLQDPLGPRFYEALFTGLESGLWKTGLSEESLEDLLDPSDLAEHAQILTEALVQAFPRDAQAAAKADQEQATPTASTGTAPSTSPSLSVISDKTPSGT